MEKQSHYDNARFRHKKRYFTLGKNVQLCTYYKILNWLRFEISQLRSIASTTNKHTDWQISNVAGSDMHYFVEEKHLI